MGAQRSDFQLNAGINRTGDPPDTVVSSEYRELSKGAQLLGAHLIITATGFGGAGFILRIQGTNQDPPGQDGQTFLLQGESSEITGDTTFMLGNADQLIPVTHCRFVRLQLVVTSGNVSDFDNLDVTAFCKTDYLTG